MKTRYVLLLLCGACGGGDGGSGPGPVTPLTITSVTPAPNGANVETGAVVTATFNQAIDPATLTAAALGVTLNRFVVPGVVHYDAATRTARAIVALLPDTTYEAQVTTAIRTPTGSALSAGRVWSFTTREWQATTVDADSAVGFYSSIRVDNTGRIHVTYSDAYDTWDLKYATCSSACTVPANWQVARVDTEGSVGEHNSLAIDATGRLHVSYTYSGNGDLKYATCATNCDSPASWERLTIDGDLIAVGWFTSLAVDATGRVHVSYNDESNGNLKYATCPSNCTVLANWRLATVDPSGVGVQSTSLGFDASGQVHIAYYDFANRDLEYATCATNCGLDGNWSRVTVDAAGDVGLDASLAVGPGGRAQIVYYDRSNGDLKYATCAMNCTSTGNWQVALALAFGDVGWFSSAAVDGNGRLHVVFYDNGGPGVLWYATCAADCAMQASWRAKAVDFPFVGMSPSIVVNGNGRIHTSYYDWGNTSLKYIR